MKNDRKKKGSGLADLPKRTQGKTMTPLSTSARGKQHSVLRGCSPALGRFLERSPLAFDGGDANLYRYVRNSPIATTDPTGEISQKEFEKLRQQGRYKTKTERIDTPLTAAELQELLDLSTKLSEKKITGAELMRREELLWQLENAGIRPEAAELEILKKIIDTTKDQMKRLPDCPQKYALKYALGYYSAGIQAAINGIAKIEQNLYERYAEARNGGASHEEVLTSASEELLNKFRARYELEQIQAQLKSTIRQFPADDDDDDEDEDFWPFWEED